MRFYLDAFWELSTCRPVSMGGEGAIPWTAIDAYARREEMDGDAYQRLKSIIRAVDSRYIDIRTKNAAEAAAEQKRIQAEEAAAVNSGEEKAKRMMVQMEKRKAMEA